MTVEEVESVVHSQAIGHLTEVNDDPVVNDWYRSLFVVFLGT